MFSRIPLPRHRRLAIIHSKNNAPSLEGFWDGRLHGGHYRLEAPKVLTGKQSRALEGAVHVPADNVAFIQVLAKSAA